jgi:hypothetical protein
MKRWVIVAGCAIVAVITLSLTLFRPAEDERVRRVLQRFAKAVAIKPDDNVLSRTGRLKSELKETVADDIYVDVPDLGIRTSSRAALVDGAVKASLVYSAADCDLTSATIKVDDAATTAKVDALAIVTGTRGGDKRIDKRPVHFLLRKDDGSWKITTIDVAAARQE